MNDIFLSYSSVDRDRAKVIANLFSKKGWTVWWDRNVPPGKPFDEVIEEAMNSAACIVVLWSDISVTSDWVKTEAAEGMRRKILVPILIDNVKIPLEFRRIQAANLIGLDLSSTNPDLAELLKSVSSITGKPLKSSTHPNSEFNTYERTSAKMADPKVSKKIVSKQLKKTSPVKISSTKSSSQTTPFKMLIIIQVVIIWIFIIGGLMFVFLFPFPQIGTTMRLLLFLPIYTGVWLTIASRSAGFRYGYILGLTTIFGYACCVISRIPFPLYAFSFTVIFGIAILPLGIISLLRLRNLTQDIG